MDILTLLIVIAFYVVFAASIRRYLQHRGVVELAVVMVFSSTAALFAIAALNVIDPALTQYLSPVAVTLLVAQPALMVRLVGLIVPLPRWAAPAAVIGFVVAIVGFYATNRSTASVLFLVGYFAVTETLAAVVLFIEARARQGFPRVRLATAGAASILFGLSIFISGTASAARGPGATSDPAIAVISRLLALIAGLGYVAAFVPPGWLRRLSHRALAFDLVRSIVSTPTGTDPSVLWGTLAVAASNILGTSRVRIQAGDRLLGEAANTRPRPLRPRPDPSRDARTQVTDVALISEGHEVARLSAQLDGRPLFLEDDLELIELLGSLTARAVEREEAVADLTDAARELEEARLIAESESRFRSLLDAEPNAILSLDDEGIIRWYTHSAAEMFGAGPLSLVGQVLEDIIETGVAKRDAVASATGVIRYETTGRRADDSTFPAEIAESPFEFDGLPSRLVVISDISWRHDADEIRDRFIGVLSHELRTPITSIFGGTQVLLSRGRRLDEDTREALLADVAAEAERLQRMIENLLILARVERGADVSEVVPVLLHRVIPEVVARERANWPSMTLETDIESGLPVVAGDEASVALVVRNLVSNAGKYAGPDANVCVSIKRETSGAVAVRVSDDGPGIDPDEAAALFTLYFRSKSSLAAPGSGIGLFVCRHLVAAMGGTMWAVRRPEGGAEFGFTLPAWSEAALDEARASSDLELAAS